MKLALIVAMTEENVIGKNNALPWHLPEDLKRFKRITTGHPIIMGRKTYESIGRVLPNRKNIIVSRNPEYAVPGAESATSLELALRLAEGAEKAFIIGGARLFEEALPRVDTLYLTLIHEDFDGDTFFPDFKLSEEFSVVARESFLDAKIPHTFLTARRLSATDKHL